MEVELFKASLETGQTAIKSAFLLNGGSAVAILAFLGKTVADKPELVSSWATVLIGFCAGVFFTAASCGLHYLSQDRFTVSFQEEFHGDKAKALRPKKTGIICKWFSNGFNSLSFIAFIYGLYEACNAFSNYS